MKTIVCNDEAARLEALYQYQILDTAPEKAFDDLVFLAAQICDTPIALINFIDFNRQWFKAKIGLDIQEIPGDIGFCRYCIQRKDPLIIPDTLLNEQWATEVVVTSEPYVRFYAAAPLLTPTGEAIGTLCIVDRVPREISEKQVESLQAISRLVVRQLEIRRNLAELSQLKNEYKQAQVALQQSESTLKSFCDSAPMMMGIVELVDNDILHIADNLTAAEFFGLQSEAMQNRCEKDIGVAHLHLRQWRPYFLHAEQTQSPVRFEEAYETPQGKKWLSVTISVIANASARSQFVYILEDISERRHAEQQLREQAALLDIVADAIILRDLSDKILLWNKSAEKIYGWTTAEALGKNANQLLNHTNSPQYTEIRNLVLKHGFWQGELQKTSLSGKEIIVESRWTLVCDEYNQAKSILVVDTDITQSQQLEKQFLRAQRMESIGTLASGIAHDLNNVLSPILMSVQLLKNKAISPSDHQILSIIENNVRRGAKLVKQVLAFARGIEGDRAVIQVKHLISDIQQIIQQTFPKSIEFFAEIQPDLSPVYADSTQLHQVLINLCVNARDAMPNGGTLTITADNILIDENYVQMHLDAKVGAYIVLTVADTGTGIERALLDRIFEPFFTTKEFGKGTGLGLSTVIGIIRSHGGFITVSSNIDQGTKFKVYLPAASTDVTQSLEDVAILNGQGELILVVDDESAILEITASSLENHNYQTMSAADGIEAIAFYAQHRDKINAAIIDMMMPNMDGATTIRTLQNINPQLPIIAVSGLATNEQIAVDNSSGKVSFLAKPYTATELLKALHKILQKS